VPNCRDAGLAESVDEEAGGPTLKEADTMAGALTPAALNIKVQL
jgi:hypothetical protein